MAKYIKVTVTQEYTVNVESLIAAETSPDLVEVFKKIRNEDELFIAGDNEDLRLEIEDIASELGDEDTSFVVG